MLAAAAIKYPSGEVVTALRHYQIVAIMANRKIKTNFSQGCEDGFVTESGHFMHRNQAREYALSIGQVHPEHKGTLYSEDLWDEDGNPL